MIDVLVDLSRFRQRYRDKGDATIFPTGGVISVIQGGKFGHGFASVGVTQAFAGSIDGIDEGQRFSPSRVAVAAVLGDITSSITL